MKKRIAMFGLSSALFGGSALFFAKNKDEKDVLPKASFIISAVNMILQFVLLIIEYGRYSEDYLTREFADEKDSNDDFDWDDEFDDFFEDE